MNRIPQQTARHSLPARDSQWDTGELVYAAARVLLPYLMVGLLMVAFS